MAGEFDIEAFTLQARAEGIDLLAAMRAEIERLSEQLRNSAAANDLTRESYDRIVPTIQALTTAYKNITRETVAAAEARKEDAKAAREAVQAAADEAERYRQYWQQKKQQIGEEKTEQQDRARVVKQTTIEILESAKKEVQAVQETRRLEAEVSREATAANELLAKSEQALAANFAVEAESRHRLLVEEQQLAAFEETEASRHQAMIAQRIKADQDVERQQRQLADTLERLAEEEAILPTAVNKSTAAHLTHGQAAQDASRKQMAFARTIYFSAQAFEDLNYGFNAVLNNIPLITVSFAQMAGKSYESAMLLAGGISIVGTGIMMLEPVLKEFAKQAKEAFNPEIFNLVSAGVKEIEVRLKTLDEKKFKVEIDFQEIDVLTEKMERLKRAKSALEGMKGTLTEEQQEAAGRFKTAAVEFAGQGDERTGVENLTGAIRESLTHGDREALLARTPQYEKLLGARKRLAETEATARNPSSARAGIVANQAIPIIQSEIDQLEREAGQNIDEQIGTGIIGEAGRGNEGAISRIQGYFEKNRGTFSKFGVGDAFGSAIGVARRKSILADPEVQERLLKRTPEGRKQHEDNELAYKNEKQAEKDQISEITAERKRKAAEEKAAEESFTPEGNEATKSGKAAGRAFDKVRREREQEVRRRAAQVEQSMAGNRESLGLNQAIENRLGGGQSVDRVVAALSAQLAAKVKDVIPADLLKDVAEKVVRSHAERVAMQGGMGMGGMAADRLGAFDQREANQGNRQAKQQFTHGLARGIQEDYGTNDAVSMKAAQESVRLGGANLNAINFVHAAVMDQMRQIQNLAHRVNQQDQQFRRNVRRGNNVHRGNNFPNRTDP